MKSNWKTMQTTAAALMLSVLPAAATQAVTPLLPFTPTVATTITNGDVNPSGVTFVPANVLTDGVSVSTTSRDVMEVTELQPFAHVAYLPAGSDLSSIKIESIKAVKVATKRRSLTNQQFCDQPWSEPGGSMSCQRTTDESSEPAYRVTYSYRGQPMASDEYNNPYLTFSVYFRPTEINSRLRDMLSLGKIRRVAVAELFEITTSMDSVQQVVIDEANSRFCDGNHVDGNWIHTNPKCEDRIAYKKVASPSPYITVRVDPASSEDAAKAGEEWRPVTQQYGSRVFTGSGGEFATGAERAGMGLAIANSASEQAKMWR